MLNKLHYFTATTCNQSNNKFSSPIILKNRRFSSILKYDWGIQKVIARHSPSYGTWKLLTPKSIESVSPVSDIVDSYAICKKLFTSLNDESKITQED